VQSSTHVPTFQKNVLSTNSGQKETKMRVTQTLAKSKETVYTRICETCN